MLNTILIIFFILGYLAIIFEKFLHVNKAALALVMAVGCWLLYFGQRSTDANLFTKQVSDVAQIIFFLLSAMIIVEIIDSHHGFKTLTDFIYTSSKRLTMWLLVFLSFFMSAVLDNLTTMIVMASLLKKLVPEEKDRWLIGSMMVISVNAGGAWSPIGDVTTTMLWIQHRLTTLEMVKWLFVPSLIHVLVSGCILSLFLRGEHQKRECHLLHRPMEPGARYVFWLGLGSLILIPVWKGVLNVPPFMGALIGLGLMWLLTDVMHVRYGQERWHLRVSHALNKIDFSGIFFFLGILFAIDALAAAGILKHIADFMKDSLGSEYLLATVIGLLSAVIDNVPLVAAVLGMYSLQDFPTNSTLWQLTAYAAGTGGSILIIGSAAGVVWMGMEKIDFLWYFKRISWIACLGYFAGIGIYLIQEALLFSR
ncbi:MAG: sodium:proton antiporter NhaD [Verrucomicrobia bacterium]|nr:sodium:proton antiporter NhaD [Verrucomicrobiota bacterium]MBS0646884.1 sodium:proton antiporter NhaD [Verrucomicrobiota bacterium]